LNSPVKILYVHHGSGEGGAANSLLYLMQNLDRSRYQPQVVCNFHAPRARQFFSEHGFPPIDLPVAPFVHTMNTWNLSTPRGFAKFSQWLVVNHQVSKTAFHRLLLDVRPDLVHLNGLSILPLAPVAKSLDLPVVQHVRESVNEGQFGIRKRWLKRLAQRYTDHIVYICADNQGRLTGKGARSSVIYNPIEFKKFKVRSGQSARRDLGIPTDHHVLFFPGGSFFEIKGIIPFLRALANVRASYPDTCAILPGLDTTPHPRDKVRQHIEQTIVNCGIQNAILRLPFSTNVEDYFSACDIVVAPFLVPHFSRAVIEAGAMAKPVVGSRIGGITEVLDDGKVGLLTTPNDHEDLARKICFLIEHHDRAIEMGRAGLTVARQRFDAVDHARAVMKVYDSVLDLPGAAK